MDKEWLKLLEKANQREEQLRAEIVRRDEEAIKREKALLDALARLNLKMNSSQISYDGKMSSDFNDVSNQIDKFVYNPDEALTFDRWIKRTETVFDSNKGKNIVEADKTAIIRSKLSMEEYNQFESHILPKAPQELSLKETINHLLFLFGRKESLFSRRYRAWQTKIKPGEDFLALAARIKKIAEDFEVDSFKKDDFTTQLFVQALEGPQFAPIRKKLLEKTDEHQAKVDAALDPASVPKLTLDTLSDLARRLADLDKVNKSVESNAFLNQEVSAINRNGAVQPMPPRNCVHCGARHWHRDCPYRELECSQCKVKGHKEGFCEKSKKFITRRNKPTPKALEIKNKNKFSRKFVKPLINGVKVDLKHDTGADWTMISVRNWVKIGKPKLSPANSFAVSASGQEVEVDGVFSATVEVNNCFGIVDVYVSSQGLNLFGNDAMEALKMWDIPISAVCSAVTDTHSATLDKVRMEFSNLFSSSLGKCNCATFSLNFKKDAKAPFMRARQVPYSTRRAVEEELRNLEKEGILTQINYADSAAPIVAVKKKSGRIRIAADYSTGLNRALETFHYPLPTAESIFTELTGKDTFTTIDLTNAYLQVELDEEAKRHMSINTHIGLFQVNRMQPGVKTASGNFQQILDRIISGTGALAYQDDIIIPGKGLADHDKRLHIVLSKLQNAGFTLAIDKCTFAQPQIKFLGRIIDAKGIRPDPEKLAAVRNMPQPKDISQLRSFLGAINWYGTFIPQLKDIRGPLDDLLKKGEKFEWTHTRIDAFNKVKQALHSSMALVHYDEKLPIVVAADASSYGIGATLLHRMQDGSLRPIAHAATSFNDAEKNYPQVEREALALVYAVKKFHQYLYGRHFELQTDHKPLLRIFGSKTGVPVHTANRLRRYALTLMGYDFKIQYINGDKFAYADFISRLIDGQAKPGAEDVVIASIREISTEINLDEAESDNFIDILRSSPISLNDLKQATAECDHLQKVIEYTRSEWPQKKSQINDPYAAEYFTVRHELRVIEECIFFGNVPIIPPKLRKRIMEELHDGHPGSSRMQALAREYCYWPGYCKQIHSFVQHCSSCASNAKSPRKEVLHPWPKPDRQWRRIHIDFAEPSRGDFFLVVVDALTNWPEVVRMRSTTASKTVAVLEEIFARWGPCSTIVSDNGPQFISAVFKEFCKRNSIEHILTAPYHPQSNGRAERFVDILKTSLSKMNGEGDSDEKLRCFLENYRRTPSTSLNNKSPFELMTGRKMPSRLDVLAAPTVKREEQQQQCSKMAQQFNHHHGAISRNFSLNDPIYYKCHQGNDWTWRAGIVVEKLGAANYSVLVDGRIIKAHANQLKQRFINDTHKASLYDSNFDDIYLSQIPDNTQDPQLQPVPRPEEAPFADDTFSEADFLSADGGEDDTQDEEEMLDSEPDQSPPAPSPTRPRRDRRAPLYLRDYEQDLDNAILIIKKLNLLKF